VRLEPPKAGQNSTGVDNRQRRQDFCELERLRDLAGSINGRPFCYPLNVKDDDQAAPITENERSSLAVRSDPL